MQDRNSVAKCAIQKRQGTTWSRRLLFYAAGAVAIVLIWIAVGLLAGLFEIWSSGPF